MLSDRADKQLNLSQANVVNLCAQLGIVGEGLRDGAPGCAALGIAGAIPFRILVFGFARFVEFEFDPSHCVEGVLELAFPLVEVCVGELWELKFEV